MVRDMTARQFLDALPMGASLKRISPDSDWVLSRANGDIGHYASVDDLLARIADEGRESARDRVVKAAVANVASYRGMSPPWPIDDTGQEVFAAVAALKAMESAASPEKLPCGCRGDCRGYCRDYPSVGTASGSG